MSEKQRQNFHIYVDESSKNHKYFAVGAVLCEVSAAREIAAFVSALVIAHGQRPDKELHWKEMVKTLGPLYSEAGTSLIAFTQDKPRKMRYRALVVESRHIVRDRASGETIEDIIAKFVFTLVFEMAKQVGAGVDYCVFIDAPDGDERSDIRTLCSLNNRYKTKFKTSEGPFKTVKFVRSEKSRLIQAADLITGAIAYEMNGRQLVPNAAAHKKKVFQDILGKSRLKTFTAPTKHYPPQFQIWHFDFAKSSFTRFKPVVAPKLDRLG